MTYFIGGQVGLAAGDIQIGAVEIKDEDSDDRAVVKTATTVATTDLVLGVADPNVAALLGPGGAASTSAATSVGDSASSVTVLAANSDRLGATIWNDSTAVLYLKLGATATAATATVRMLQYDHYEVPSNYTGIIDGIWASDAGGNARVTEFTA